MAIKVLWTGFAQNKLEDIFHYHKKEVSVNVSAKLINGIIDETIRLKTHPLYGTIEALLIHRIQEFRYLVYKNYKIIYFQEEASGNIIIVNVFDTRQNPTKIELDSSYEILRVPYFS